MAKQIKLTDFLTEVELSRIIDLWDNRVNDQAFHGSVLDEIIRPNMARINQSIGQENDPVYLAYMIEYLMVHLERQAR